MKLTGALRIAMTTSIFVAGMNLSIVKANAASAFQKRSSRKRFLKPR